MEQTVLPIPLAYSPGLVQLLQVGAFPQDAFPAGHESHSVSLVASQASAMYFPTPQAVQELHTDWLESVWNLPLSQSKHELLPPEEYFPGWQSMQEFVSPSARFPGPQKVQVEDPFVLLTNPFSMSHCVQLVEAAPEIIPTGQRVQLVALASEKRPASHKEQDSAPSVEYVPPPQS